MVKKNSDSKKVKKSRAGRKKVPEGEKLVIVAGKVPPVYVDTLKDIAVEQAVKLNSYPNMSLVVRQACECLIRRERPDVWRALKLAFR